jgi:hypothetical protein
LSYIATVDQLWDLWSGIERARTRVIFGVHEAGHAVAAETQGIQVDAISLLNDRAFTQRAEASPEPHDALVTVMVAGYAAVGVLLGGEAEAWNRRADPPLADRSDLVQAVDTRRRSA